MPNILVIPTFKGQYTQLYTCAAVILQHHTHNVFGLFVRKSHANMVHKEVAQAGQLPHTSGRYHTN